jgi:integrase
MASYKFTPLHPSAPWRVYFRGRSFYCKTEGEAKKKVDELEKSSKGAFSARELDEYRHAKELLQGASLLAAVRAYVEFQQGEENITVAVAIKRFLEGTGGRPDYVEKKEYFLSRLRDAVGDKRIGAVTPSDILAASLKFRSDWMKNDFVRHSGILFRYCIKMRITRNEPTSGVAERKVKPSKIILSLPDTEHLLATCKECLPEILPAVALQLFMGIRTTEVCRLEWSAVKLGEHVDISPEVSKTHERRVIDWWAPRLSEYIGLPCKGTIVPRPRGWRRNRNLTSCGGRTRPAIPSRATASRSGRTLGKSRCSWGSATSMFCTGTTAAIGLPWKALRILA